MYKEKKVFYYQKIENATTEEIKEYLLKNFDIEDLKINQKNEILIKSETSHNFFKPKKSKLFKLYLIYLFLLCIGFYFYDFNSLDDDNFKQLNKNINSIKSNTEYKYFSKEIVELYEKANIHSIKIRELEFRYSDILLKIESKSKDKIYEFSKGLSSSKIEKIKYDNKMKRLISDVSFKIIRK